MLRDGLARHTLWILIVLAAALELAFLGLFSIENPADRLDDVYGYFGSAFCVYFLTVIYVHYFWNRSFFSPEWILVSALVFRLTLLPNQPLLSDDIYRYIWDGMVANSGIDPYRYAPDAANLIGLRDEIIFPLINHKEVPTIYPPLLQYVFQAVTYFSTSPIAMKAVFVVFDMATIVVLMRLLTALDKSIAWVVVYAWNPLVIMETSLNGHADPVAVFLMMLGLYLAVQARSIWAALALSASFLAKFFAIVLLPFLEDVRTRARIVGVILLASLALVAAAYGPFFDSRDYWFLGLHSYSATWEFNSSLYAATYSILKKEMALSGTFLGIVTDNRARLASKILLAGVGALTAVGLLIVHYRKSYHEQKPHIIRAAFILTGLALLISPTLHPWYLIWIVPFLCLRPNLAWLLLSGLIVLSYESLRVFGPTGSDMFRWWIYGPFYTLLVGMFLWKFILRIRKAHPGESSS